MLFILLAPGVAIPPSDSEPAAPDFAAPAAPDLAAPSGLRLAVVAIAVIVGLAAWRWLPGLDPVSLYLDDAWQAVQSRLPLDRQYAYRTSAPVGFTLLLTLAMRVIADPELAVQSLPFLAGLAAIPAVGWLAWRLSGRPWCAVLAAALLAVNPTFGQYAVRAKQYSLDALLLVLLAALATPAPRAGSGSSTSSSDGSSSASPPPPGPPWRLVVAGLLALPFSFCAAVLGTLLINVHTLHGLLRDRRSADLRPCLTKWLAYHLPLGLYYLVVLRGQSNALLKDFWAAQFPGSPGALLARYGDLLARSLPFGDPGDPNTPSLVHTHWPWALLLAVFIGLGIAALWRDPQRRPVAVAALLFYLALGSLAVLQLYPLGGGRTDLWTVPLSLALAVVGLHSLLRRKPVPAAIAPRLEAAALLAILLLPIAFLRLAPPIRYPDFGRTAPLVQRAEGLLHEVPSTALVLGGYGAFSFGFYTSLPVVDRPVDYFIQGFVPVPTDLDVYVIPTSDATLADATLAGPALDPLFAAGYTRILHFGEKNLLAMYLHERLAAAGYAGYEVDGGEVFTLGDFVRQPPPAAPAGTAAPEPTPKSD